VADRRATSIARLSSRLQSRTGQAIAYTRPGSPAQNVELVGTLTQPGSDGEIGAFGAAGGLDLARVDLVADASDLAAINPPRTGDTFIATVDGTEHRFEVVRDSGEAAYRYCDPLRTMIRIHARHLEATT
jgi:hypothetical protein